MFSGKAWPYRFRPLCGAGCLAIGCHFSQISHGKAGIMGKPSPSASIHTDTKHSMSDRHGPSRSGRASRLPIAPRAGLDDLAQAFQPSSPFGQARGVLPLAVWLDGDQSHGQGLTVCQGKAM
ncbi:MAG: hypothetical protein NTX45_04570 [Proteobacteria bacterium]|nr:hypothetical protein [Pseudomonadota bacterium]